MSGLLLLLIALVLFPGVAQADRINEFQNVADRGPIDDETCARFGGVPIPVTDKERKTIIRSANNVDRRLYYEGFVYVMYGSNAKGFSNLAVPTYTLTLCRFPR